LSLTRVLHSGLLLACLGAAALLAGQSALQRGQPLTVVTGTGRVSLPVTIASGQDMVSLDDLAKIFDLTVREDAAAGGITVSHRDKTLVLSPTQGLASVGGRLVSLPAAPVPSGRSWLVPLEAIARALPLIVDAPVELRRTARLVIAGDARVPRVVVRGAGEGGQARLTIDVTPQTGHAVSLHAGRLVVAFEADWLETDLTAPSPGELVQAVRFDPPATVAIDLGPAFASYRASDVPIDPASTRLVLDILAAGAVASSPGPSPPPAPAPPVPEGPAPVIRTIVIDPGHGGTEHGAAGPGGTLEKDVSLAVARQFKAVLEARLGVRVMLTRDGDQTVPLDERAAIANNNQADLFLSLHANASVRSGVTGAEVFYLSLDEYGQAARQAATEPGELLPLATGGERQLELILWEMAQARHLEDSAVLAAMIEEELRARVPMSARAIQQAPFRVLVGANMPAVLVEMGFITNPAEEKKLASTERQTEIALALYQSVVRFRAFLEGGRRRPDRAAPPVVPAPGEPRARAPEPGDRR
jgi:N-acetylmuramoyl-L-alanine amidase